MVVEVTVFFCEKVVEVTVSWFLTKDDALLS
jgi:hypothetical protein